MNFKSVSQQFPSVRAMRFFVGAVAFVVGVIAQHPLLALGILACALAWPAWKFILASNLQREQRKAQMLTQATIVARQRQQERQNAGTPPPLAQIASSATVTAPPSATAVTPFEFDVPVAPLPQATLKTDFDWQAPRGVTPPSVMPKSTTFAPMYGSSESATEAFDDASFAEQDGNDSNAPRTTLASLEAELQEAANADDTDASGLFQRIDLGGRDGYRLVKVVYRDRPNEVAHFELLRDLELICRGSQAQVKAALQAVLRSS